MPIRLTQVDALGYAPALVAPDFVRVAQLIQGAGKAFGGEPQTNLC